MDRNIYNDIKNKSECSLENKMKTYRNSSDGSINIKTKLFTSGKMEVIQKSIFT